MSKSVGTQPSSYEKRIYWAAVSQRLRYTAVWDPTVKISPVTCPEGPRGFQEVKVPRFRDKGTGWW